MMMMIQECAYGGLVQVRMKLQVAKASIAMIVVGHLPTIRGKYLTRFPVHQDGLASG